MVQRQPDVMRRYHKTSSVLAMMEHLQWPTLAQQRCCLRLTMLFKIKNTIVAINPSPYLKPTHFVTRTNFLSFPPYRWYTESSKFSGTIPLWNNLPNTIVLYS